METLHVYDSQSPWNKYYFIQWTPLIAACQKGHNEVVKLLLENGASISTESNNKVSLFRKSL